METGPYAYIRHPQYVGFALIMFGFLLQWPTLITLALFPVLLSLYARLARREELDSLAGFGEAYRQYMMRTPAFVPRRGGALPPARQERRALHTGHAESDEPTSDGIGVGHRDQ